MIEELLKGDRRALARAISVVENNDSLKREVLKDIYPHTGKAYIIGFTGYPGSGKSSLVDRLIYVMRKEGLKVGVIAIDPTSPFSGGAFLGDRIRMQEHTGDKDVFIRSMGTRGSLGGLSRATGDVVQLLDAFGKDIIIIETVGVGQSEVDIVKNADTTIVVLTPASGDSIQVIKAGIMEIADIFVINKSDIPGAERTKTEINIMLDLDKRKKYRPPVVQTITMNNEGIVELWEEINKHRHYLESEGILEHLRKERARRDVTENLEHLVKNMLWGRISGTAMFEQAIEKINNKELDPFSAAQGILEKVNLDNRS